MLTAFVTTTPAAAASDDAAQIGDLIDRMNRAISERNLDALLSTFADGGVKVDLFPAHQFGSAAETASDTVRTADLQQRWRAVTPILFNTTRIYQRTADIVDLHIDRGLAVAWLEISTEILSIEPNARQQNNRFMEICILRRYDDGWKIVALSNNRHDPAP